MLKSKRRTDTCGFSRGAGGVLDSYTALSREIRAETAPCDKKVVDPLYGKGAEGQLVPRLSVVSGCDRGKVQRFSVNVNRVGRAADAVGKFAPGQQILCRDDVFRHDVPALAHADRRGNVGDIRIFKAGQIFAVKGHLPQNRPLSGKTDEGEIIGVCAVVMGEEFGIVEGDAAASAVYAEALPVYPVVLRKVAVFRASSNVPANAHLSPGQQATDILPFASQSAPMPPVFMTVSRMKMPNFSVSMPETR